MTLYAQLAHPLIGYFINLFVATILPRANSKARLGQLLADTFVFQSNSVG